MGSGPFNPTGLKRSFHDLSSFIKKESPLLIGGHFPQREAGSPKERLPNK